MKSFKVFLLEMPWLTGETSGKGNTTTPKPANYQKISEFNGYNILKDEYNNIHAQDKKSKKIHMRVELSQDNQVQGLDGFKNSRIKAHELYRHLILYHGYTLKSDTTHTVPSMHTWRKLSEYPDIKVTHHNPKGNLPMNAPFEKNYSASPRDKNLAFSYFKAIKK